MTPIRFMRRCALLAFVALSVCQSAQAARTIVVLADGWHFKQADGLSGVETPGFDDATWSKISVPHTWNRIGNAGTERAPESNSVQGVGWYRLWFDAPASARGRRAFLQFDGVSEVADIWLNGRHVGRHEGAFSRFRIDVSDTLRPGGRNLLVVKADNSRPQPGSATANVYPLTGDFFVFGGLYREVSLVVTDPCARRHDGFRRPRSLRTCGQHRCRCRGCSSRRPIGE